MIPYRTTAEFNERTIPSALLRQHATKAGTWGVIRIMEGALDLVFFDPPREIRLTPACPGRIAPNATHCVRVSGPVRMKIEFYDRDPAAETF
ncbi:DUF1971 domain-containing protein [Acetobacter sicerae]|uniref:DUF1971 domain-containing protein n=1 Tax=Acetobacter sicerae TaxID=85325 RepID=UPI00156BB433|nr:DUF1971 domain-containing protein [Acetobacter sicerae]NHN93835.1 DUF1971 domain-containing protein [Acetobacter sicerae]